jgi:hypothetical protein
MARWTCGWPSVSERMSTALLILLAVAVRDASPHPALRLPPAQCSTKSCGETSPAISFFHCRWQTLLTSERSDVRNRILEGDEDRGSYA